MYRKSFQALFTIFCCTTFTFMVIYWLYKYKVIDRDIGVLSLISLEDAKDVNFPSPSFCIIDPFIENEFNTIDFKINSTDYLDYLKGNAKSDSVETIDYEKETLNLSKYFCLPHKYGKTTPTQLSTAPW